LPGVTSARVTIEARTVTIEVDETVTDRARLVAAIEEQGYDVPA
jgi:copper chaperone CopZ